MAGAKKYVIVLAGVAGGFWVLRAFIYFCGGLRGTVSSLRASPKDKKEESVGLVGTACRVARVFGVPLAERGLS